MKTLEWPKFPAIFLAAMIWSSGTGEVQAQTEREVLIETFSRVSNSVGALYALESGGDMKFLCSATGIGRKGNKTIILTAYHCVKKGVSYLINFGDNRFYPLHVWKIPHYEVSAIKYPRAYSEPKTDMVLFLMDGMDIPVVELSETAKPVTGSKVVMVGFPLGIAKISYEGIVAGHLDRPGADDTGYILLQIFGAPGSSGSAVVSVETGNIVGVLVKGTNNRGLPVVFATPIDYRKNLMVVPGAPKDKASEAIFPINPKVHP